jgi:hypothetical protein
MMAKEINGLLSAMITGLVIVQLIVDLVVIQIDNRYLQTP